MNNTRAIAESNPTISYYRPSKAEGIAFSCVFIVACFFIVAGNLLTIVLFTLSKKLRKRSFFLVMNMAVSDLLVGAVSLPIYIYRNRDYFRLGKFKTSRYLFFSYIFVDTFLTQVQPRSQGFSPPRRGWAGKDPGIGRSRDFQTPRKVGCNKLACNNTFK